MHHIIEHFATSSVDEKILRAKSKNFFFKENRAASFGMKKTMFILVVTSIINEDVIGGKDDSMNTPYFV